MFKPSHISKIYQDFMKCVTLVKKNFTCPPFFLENSDNKSPKTRDQ